MSQDVSSHCREIERCNQRGGRMLSIIDLISAGTLSIDAAAYCAAAISDGASFLVGARPGGAGKTTVMGALLNFVPTDVDLVAADSSATIDAGLAETAWKKCYICHEIGAGAYYAYLWGADLRRYFDLPESGHMLATNLHADFYEEARSQICDENGVSDDALRQMNLMLFLHVEGRYSASARRIVSIWESDGHDQHRELLASGDSDIDISQSGLVNQAKLDFWQSFLQSLLDRRVKHIEAVREAVLQHRSD